MASTGSSTGVDENAIYYDVSPTIVSPIFILYIFSLISVMEKSLLNVTPFLVSRGCLFLGAFESVSVTQRRVINLSDLFPNKGLITPVLVSIPV